METGFAACERVARQGLGEGLRKAIIDAVMTKEARRGKSSLCIS
jgi:hypothetical protein